MARKFLQLILALLAASVLAFAAAPLFAFRALGAAARDGDAQALAELIDYRAVRESLRPQLAAQAAAAAPPPPDPWRDPIGAVRRALEPLAPAPPAVELYLTPAALHDLTRGYRPGRAPAETPDRAAFSGLRYWGPNRVRFATRPAGDRPAGAAVVFTFQRRGPFAWKLVHIGLPSA